MARRNDDSPIKVVDDAELRAERIKTLAGNVRACKEELDNCKERAKAAREALKDLSERLERLCLGEPEQLPLLDGGTDEEEDEG